MIPKGFPTIGIERWKEIASSPNTAVSSRCFRLCNARACYKLKFSFFGSEKVFRILKQGRLALDSLLSGRFSIKCSLRCDAGACLCGYVPDVSSACVCCTCLILHWQEHSCFVWTSLLALSIYKDSHIWQRSCSQQGTEKHDMILRNCSVYFGICSLDIWICDFKCVIYATFLP